MRKICFIINSLTGGGAERLVVTLADEMARRGISVHIITLFDNCNYRLAEGICYHTLAGNSDNWFIKQKLGRKLRGMVDALEAESPFDLIIANLLRSSEVVRRAGLKNVHYCINNPLGEQIRHTRPRLLQAWWHGRLRRLYNNENLICVSRGVARNLTETLRMRPASVSVIYNGFEFDAIARLSKAPQPTADALKPFVLHVGHFKRQKRLDLLLDAWAMIRPVHKLVLLGKGSPRKMQRLKEQAARLGIAENIVFAGWHENAYAWMKRADLLVLSSDFEGFGRVIVEAIATGTPVVSTDCPSGPAEILSGDMRQWLVPRGDVRALAEKIRLALQSPPAVEPSVVERFSIERVVDQYLNLPLRQEALAHRPSGQAARIPPPIAAFQACTEAAAKKVLFIPVSGPTGAGEYYRCLSLAEGLLRRQPGWEIHFLLNRSAQVLKPSGIIFHLLPDSPTYDNGRVRRIMDELRPDAVVFDNTLRGSQLNKARQIRASVIYISARPHKRRKGFALRKLPHVDRHWIIAPPSRHRLSIMEAIALRLAGGIGPEFFSLMLPDPAPQRRAAFLAAHSFADEGYTLFVSGGGGGSIKGQPAASVFQQAARSYHEKTGRPTLFVAGPLSTIALASGEQRLELRSVSPGQLADLMDGAVLVVSGGGSIVHQALSLARPCLAIPAGGKDQPHRVRDLKKQGLIEICAPEPSVMGDAAANLSEDTHCLRQLAENARQGRFVNGLGQALDEIEGCVENPPLPRSYFRSRGFRFTRLWPGKRKAPRKMPGETCFADGRKAEPLLSKLLGGPVASAEILNHHGFLSLKVRVGDVFFKVAECESEKRAVLAESALKAVARDSGPVPRFICRTGAVIVCEWVYGTICKKEPSDLQFRYALECQEKLYKTALPEKGGVNTHYVHLESLLMRFTRLAPRVIPHHRIKTIVSRLRERLPAPGLPRIIHPDLTPPNIIVNGHHPVVIDNEVIAIGSGCEFDVWNTGEALFGQRDMQGIERYVRAFHERCPTPTLFEHQPVWDDFRRLRRAMKAIEKGRLIKGRRIINRINGL